MTRCKAKVEAVASAARISDEAMKDGKNVGQRSAGDDPVAAFKPIWQMASTGEQAVAFLDSQLSVEAIEESDEMKSHLKDFQTG